LVARKVVLMPTTTGDYIMLTFMIIAALAVVAGVVLMAVNNQYNKKYANQLMQMRVLFQGLALVVLFVVVWLST
jgi:ABC-type siderophore export system fused ATPase/permease subunit